MAKIVIGKQLDKSSSTTVISLDKDSSAEINFKTIKNESIRKIYIDDRDNKNNLSYELSKLRVFLHEEKGELGDEVKAIEKAQEAIDNDDSTGMIKWLRKAGNVAFEVSVQNGLLLVAKVLKNILV